MSIPPPLLSSINSDTAYKGLSAIESVMVQWCEYAEDG